MKDMIYNTHSGVEGGDASVRKLHSRWWEKDKKVRREKPDGAEEKRGKRHKKRGALRG